MQALSQLSYTPKICIGISDVDVGGTLSQLSYTHGKTFIMANVAIFALVEMS